MPSTKLISTTQQLDRDGLATLLSQLADRIRTGEVVLNRGEESLTLALPQSMEVDVDVTQEDKTSGMKMELEIEIQWYEGAAGEPQNLTLG